MTHLIKDINIINATQKENDSANEVKMTQNSGLL